MEYIVLTEAVHPKTKETYKIGDKVVIYQGRFGHNNIITINSLFTTDIRGDDNIYVSDRSYTEKDYNTSYPNNPTGTYISAIKRKITDKEIKELQRARALVDKYR